MSQKYPETLPTAQVLAGVRSMGIEPEHVVWMKIETDTITMEVFDLGEDGRRRVDETGDDAVRREVTVKLV